jgi:hypothetical protein
MRDSKERGIRQYAAMTKKTYAGVCEGFDYFSPTDRFLAVEASLPTASLLHDRTGRTGQDRTVLVWQPETTVAVAV